MSPENDLEPQPDPAEDEWQESDSSPTEADLWWEWLESW